MPTPDSQPEEHRFASPVPRYRVFPLGSLGSATSEPTEFRARPPSSQVQLGFAARASFVRQTPPPAVPTQSRQFPATQVGATTIAVSRLGVAVVAPEHASTPGWREGCSGP